MSEEKHRKANDLAFSSSIKKIASYCFQEIRKGNEWNGVMTTSSKLDGILSSLARSLIVVIALKILFESRMEFENGKHPRSFIYINLRPNFNFLVLQHRTR